MAYPVKYYDALNMFQQKASYVYDECVNDQGLKGAELTTGKTKNNWSGTPNEAFGDSSYLASDGRVIVYMENIVLYPSITSLAIGLLICASCATFPNGILLASVGIFAATGMGTCLSSGLAVIGCAAHGNKAAPGIATFYLLSDLGCGIGPVLLGVVAGSLGYEAMYVACACIALLGVVYYHFAHGRTMLPLPERAASEI